VADRYVEREVKLDVDEAYALPDLSDLVPAGGSLDTVGLHLDSLYFDSAERDLLSARVTLRRRNGGADDTGWQLKLPTGDARTEVRLPPTSGSTVPKELRDLTAGLRRGRPLRKLANVRVERTAHRILDVSGSLLAEIADDRVRTTTLDGQAVVSAWREVEVELGSGDRAFQRRIEKRLVRAGAHPAVSSSKLGRAVAAPDEGDAAPAEGPPSRSTVGGLVQAYLREQRQALLDGDVELRSGSDAIHHTRVASRRFRSTLRTYGSIYADGRQAADLESELRWYAGMLGAVRDADVLRQHLQGVLHDLPEQVVLGPVASRVEQELLSDRERHHAALMRVLNGRRYFALLDLIDRWLADPPFNALAGQPATNAVELADHAQRKLDKRLAGVAVHEDDPEGVHSARKAAKRARYAVELIAPALPAKVAKRRVKGLKTLQDTLGEFQDSVVAHETLLRLGVKAGTTPGENGFTYGLLYGLEQRRAEIARRTVIDKLR
jgi:CHAD domain-containing protein